MLLEKFQKGMKLNELERIFVIVEKRIFLSLVLTIMFIIIMFIISIEYRRLCACFPNTRDCTDYYSYLLIKSGCHCTCTSIDEVSSQYLWYVIIPFVIIYSILTLIAEIYRRYVSKRVKR
jgi:hypothetical protein